MADVRKEDVVSAPLTHLGIGERPVSIAEVRPRREGVIARWRRERNARRQKDEAAEESYRAGTREKLHPRRP